MKRILLSVVCGMIVLSCGMDDAGAWSDTDLLPYGIPITIEAPDSIVVKNSEVGGLMTDVTIKSDEPFDIQIYASDAETNDIAAIKADQLQDVKGNRYFSRIVREEEPGFVFENRIDSNTVNYGFRYVYLQGDKEYIFQTGLSGLFTLEETERMFEAVKQAKR